MVSTILNAAMGMMGIFAFFVFLFLSACSLVPILGLVYCVIVELGSWIKSFFD